MYSVAGHAGKKAVTLPIGKTIRNLELYGLGLCVKL